MYNNACYWPRNRLSIVYNIEQVSMLLEQRLVEKESESTMTRERLNRLWARPFDFSSSCIPSWARSRRRWKRRRWKEAVGRKEGYTKYGGKRDGATRIEKEDDAGRRETQREWDEKFSLASLRCLYTRGSCIAMGYISVLRERGAPPKNQIECKNRINSSCKLESYVCPVGSSLSKLSLFLFLFSLSVCFFSFLHTLYLKPVWSFSLSLCCPSPLFLHNQVYKLAWLHLEERPITFYIFFYSACLPARKLCG